MANCCGFGNGFPAGFFILMLVGMLLGLVLLVVLIWALVRWLSSLVASPSSRSDGRLGATSAEDILRERYARGEIDAATYSGVPCHWASDWRAGRGPCPAWRSSLTHSLQKPLYDAALARLRGMGRSGERT